MNIKLKTCGGESILKDECWLHDIHESYTSRLLWVVLTHMATKSCVMKWFIQMCLETFIIRSNVQIIYYAMLR